MDKKLAENIENFRSNLKNVDYDDLVKICKKLFGKPRQSGSHLIFRTGLSPPEHQVNVQRFGKHAKPYQVKQFLRVCQLLDKQ